MAYVDRDSSRETALSGVIAAVLVGGIGFGLVTGLAMKVVHDPEHHVVLNQWSEPVPPPPPPPEHRAPPRAHAEAAVSTPVPPPTLVPRVQSEPTIILPHIDESVVGAGSAGPVPPPPAIDRSSRTIPRGDPSGWVTADDYPPAALRAGLQGITAFRLDIGADGRATACTITASSGSGALDQTACRMVMRRARFAAARDTGGEPVATTWSSRIEWRVPAD